MSVKDLNKVIIVTDCMTADVITTIDKSLFNIDHLGNLISDLFISDFYDEHGIQITYGFKS